MESRGILSDRQVGHPECSGGVKVLSDGQIRDAAGPHSFIDSGLTEPRVHCGPIQ